MEFPKKSKTHTCGRRLSTQKSDCQICSWLNQEVCGLCGKQILSVRLSNKELIGGKLPDNTCQCFFPTNSEIDVPEKAGFKSERKTALPTTQVCSSSNVDLLKSVKQKFCLDNGASTIAEKGNSKNRKESKKLEFSNSLKSNALSPDKQCDQNFVDHRNITFPSSGEESKTQEFSSSLNGYSLSPDEQFDQNFTSHRNINFPSSVKESRTKSYTDNAETDRQNPDESESKISSEHKNGSGEVYNCNQSSHSEQCERFISSELNKFSFENRNIFPVPRTLFRRPFYEPYIYPTRNMLVATPFPQTYQLYMNPSMPVIRTNIPGRFSVTSRPQLNTSYHQQPNTERHESSFSKKLRAHTQQFDSKANLKIKLERIENWLGEVECNPPDEEPSSEWAQAENEYSFSGLSTDEKSSGEISEEKNHRERSLRHPLRNVKRNKSK